MTQETYCLPECWASYLINGDSSSISNAELAQIAEFLGRDYMQGFNCVGCSDEPEFKRSNDAGTLGGNCLDYTFLK